MAHSGEGGAQVPPPNGDLPTVGPGTTIGRNPE